MTAVTSSNRVISVNLETSEPVYSVHSEQGTATSSVTPQITGYQGCVINVNPVIHWSGHGGYPDLGYQVPEGVHYQVPELPTERRHAETLDTAEDDWYRENVPEPFEAEIDRQVFAAARPAPPQVPQTGKGGTGAGRGVATAPPKGPGTGKPNASPSLLF